MDFILGCNYWASHAGTRMWRDWDEEIVRRDFAKLKSQGMEVLRVFPLWTDFQPVKVLYEAQMRVREYRMTDDRLPDNAFFLDPVQLRHFHSLCQMAEEQDLKLIVGLVTGWMSGRLFVPPALDGTNLFTDFRALWLAQLYVHGLVSELCGEAAVLAWDLGNECNCMGEAVREEAAHWTAMITDAIRACDPSRPILSGMHSLTCQGPWSIADQGMWNDILTTHPYPCFVPHASLERNDSLRALLHATAETVLYANISGKPCLVEELGLLGPMRANEDITAGFLRVNLFSCWAHGAAGLLWWCAFDQSHLDFPPYSWNMCERELGMFLADGQPRPLAREFRYFCEKTAFLSLPPYESNAVCILTREQDNWGVAYAAFILAKQAGLTLAFAYCDQPLPKASAYLLPSVTGNCVMEAVVYHRLMEHIREGAVLLITNNRAPLTEFTALTGLTVEDGDEFQHNDSMDWDGHHLVFNYPKKLYIHSLEADILAKDSHGIPVFTRHRYGKGDVFYLNFPLESSLIQQPEGFGTEAYHVYRTAFAKLLNTLAAFSANPSIGVTLHRQHDFLYAVCINYSAQSQDMKLILNGATISRVLYGNPDRLPPFDSCLMELKMLPIF